MQYCIFFNCKIVLNTFLLIDLSDTEKSTEKKNPTDVRMSYSFRKLIVFSWDQQQFLH